MTSRHWMFRLRHLLERYNSPDVDRVAAMMTKALGSVGSRLEILLEMRDMIIRIINMIQHDIT